MPGVSESMKRPQRDPPPPHLQTHIMPKRVAEGTRIQHRCGHDRPLQGTRVSEGRTRALADQRLASTPSTTRPRCVHNMPGPRAYTSPSAKASATATVFEQTPLWTVLYNYPAPFRHAGAPQSTHQQLPTRGESMHDSGVGPRPRVEATARGHATHLS